MIVAVPKEQFAGERRVALVPASVPTLTQAGMEVLVQHAAGEAAGFSDAIYAERGGRIVADRAEIFTADVVLQVRVSGTGTNPAANDLEQIRPGQTLIGLADPLGSPQVMERLASHGATLFALELIPRITRAQSMDVLSSMATVAGYRAVLLAATAIPKMFPLLMTAAGTIG